MKTQEELQHEADRQKRSDEITLLLEWPDDVTRHSGDGGESLSTWYDEIERNQLQSKRDAEEKEWYANERSRAATADNYWNEELDYE